MRKFQYYYKAIFLLAKLIISQKQALHQDLVYLKYL